MNIGFSLLAVLGLVACAYASNGSFGKRGAMKRVMSDFMNELQASEDGVRMRFGKRGIAFRSLRKNNYEDTYSHILRFGKRSSVGMAEFMDNLKPNSDRMRWYKAFKRYLMRFGKRSGDMSEFMDAMKDDGNRMRFGKRGDMSKFMDSLKSQADRLRFGKRGDMSEFMDNLKGQADGLRLRFGKRGDVTAFMTNLKKSDGSRMRFGKRMLPMSKYHYLKDYDYPARLRFLAQSNYYYNY